MCYVGCDQLRVQRRRVPKDGGGPGARHGARELSLPPVQRGHVAWFKARNPPHPSQSLWSPSVILLGQLHQHAACVESDCERAGEPLYLY